MDTIHKFEDAGLGKAPFKFVGVFEIPSKAILEANPEAYNNALRDMPPGFHVGSCAYCGMGIMYNYLIVSADGQKHSVGCECIKKVGDSGLMQVVDKEKRARERAKREEERKARWAARAAEQRAREQAALDAQRERNGGLTDAEMRALIVNRRAAILTPLATELEDGQDGFCDSVAHSLKHGDRLSDKQFNIMVDILGKKKGKRGSQAYNDESDRVCDIYDSAFNLDDQKGEKTHG